MKIGILETGPVSPKLKKKFGTYGHMFQELIARVTHKPVFEEFDIIESHFPNSPIDADLWFITGSKFGVYDELPWLEPLKCFLVNCIGKNIPVIGVCFGHQILAEALGGKVTKFDRGWGLGVHEYEILKTPNWIYDLKKSFKGYAVHQDQVIVNPPNATRIAGSSFCKNAMLAYGNIESPHAISIQSHPELSGEFVSALIKLNRNNPYPELLADIALKNINQKVDNHKITELMINAVTQGVSKGLFT